MYGFRSTVKAFEPSQTVRSLVIDNSQDVIVAGSSDGDIKVCILLLIWKGSVWFRVWPVGCILQDALNQSGNVRFGVGCQQHCIASECISNGCVSSISVSICVIINGDDDKCFLQLSSFADLVGRVESAADVPVDWRAHGKGRIQFPTGRSAVPILSLFSGAHPLPSHYLRLYTLGFRTRFMQSNFLLDLIIYSISLSWFLSAHPVLISTPARWANMLIIRRWVLEIRSMLGVCPRRKLLPFCPLVLFIDDRSFQHSLLGNE